MGTVVELFRDTAFDPEVVALLCAAYEEARKSLHSSGQPHVLQEVIARRIIASAERGERNPDKLCEDALSRLGLKAVLER
jgi:hypothetical protein